MAISHHTLGLAAALIAGNAAHAASFTYTDVTPSGATQAQVNGLNDSDVVTGYAVEGNEAGFWWANGTAQFANATSALYHVNDSGIATAEPPYREDGQFAEFNIATGKFTTYALPPPNVDAFSQFIDTAGTLAGEQTINRRKGISAAYTLDTSGTVTEIAPPNTSNCRLSAMSPSGTIIGACLAGKIVSPVDFIYSNGSYTTLKLRGATALQVDFVTDDNVIGGTYSKAAKSGFFLYANGMFQLFKPKVKGYAFPYGLAGQGPNGEIAGTYCRKSNADCHGFIYLPLTAQSYLIDYPGASETYIVGVNSLGSIAGSYSGSQGSDQRGFIEQCAGGGSCTE
jgi:hypothetical protein